jgi:hypothetical protein
LANLALFDRVCLVIEQLRLMRALMPVETSIRYGRLPTDGAGVCELIHVLLALTRTASGSLARGHSDLLGLGHQPRVMLAPVLVTCLLLSVPFAVLLFLLLALVLLLVVLLLLLLLLCLFQTCII